MTSKATSIKHLEKSDTYLSEIFSHIKEDKKEKSGLK